MSSNLHARAAKAADTPVANHGLSTGYGERIKSCFGAAKAKTRLLTIRISLALRDGVFTLNKKKVYAIADEITKVDKELLRHLKRAGCYAIAYDIESASQEILNTLNKDITLEQVEEARAYREFYLRPSYIWQRLGQITSIGDFKVILQGFSMLLGNIKGG